MEDHMRKLAVWILSFCLLLGIFALTAVPAFATTSTTTTTTTKGITLTSPNGAENWSAGSVHAVKWSFFGLTGNVKIELYKNDTGLIGTIVSNRSAGSRSYNWSIPWDLTPGNDYKIRISSMMYPIVYDDSDAFFTVSAPSITVVSPDGGENWGAGTTHSIKWTSTGTTGTVKIELYKNGALNAVISSNRAIGTGSSSMNWAIPASQTAGSDYYVKITSNSKTDVYDNSTNNFSIGPALTLTSPVGGETWITGSTHAITWNYTTYTGLTGNIKIELLQNGVVKKIISSSRPVSSGTYSWIIPKTLPYGTDYAIRISSVTNKAISSTSGTFRLDGSRISTVSPNSDSDIWIAGSAHNICWNVDNVTGWLRIELYRHGFGPTAFDGDEYVYDRLIASGRDAPVLIGVGPGYVGSYRWHLPLDLMTGDYKVKLISLSNEKVYDYSDVDFHIVGSSITVVTPAGGENWGSGSTYTLEWDFTGVLTGDVKIDLYKDGLFQNEISYAPIGAFIDPAGSGSYDWTIPSNQSSFGTDNYSIRITSVLFPAAFDDSDLFSIQPSNNVITTELSSSTIIYGDNVTDNVTVTPLVAGTPGGTVDFQVSTDSGVNWTTYDSKALVSAKATSDNYTPDKIGTYYFRALYNGDSTFAPSQSGNLDEPLTVTPKALTVTGIIANDKPWDGNTLATLNFSGASLVGVALGDTVNLDNSSYIANFDTPDPGYPKPVTVTGLGLSGADAGNYTLTQPTDLFAEIWED
jgi:hypothetical protein